MNAEVSEVVVGSHVRIRREALGLTRKQLAHRVGCSIETIRKIESGERQPSRQMAKLLAQVLSLSLHRSPPSVPPTNLPAPMTSFIDRTNELTTVRARLQQMDVRLLTLVGPPGIGKTRLSIQAGQAVIDHFDDGVWFVGLAPISDPALVLHAIARTFDIADDGGATPLLARLQDHLRPKQLLLVLDNFEQVLDAALTVTDLLKACPKLKVIATSREPLHIYGEQEYPMPALSLPPRERTLTVEQVAEFDAIRLFVARAQAIQPSFALSAGNAQAVTDICRRLDGLPLAIELAASRLRQSELFKLRDTLNDAPLQALVGIARDAEPRQRTLRSAIQWSYDLLSTAERATFTRLGVFVGGCTTDAALAVCELTDDSMLHTLADRNLLKRESERDANERWTMLETIREFALDALAQSSGDEVERTRQRHAEYFARLLKHDSDAAYHVIDVEQHNARAALRWLLDHKHPLTGELAHFMDNYFSQASLLNEARRMWSEVLSADIDMASFTRSDLLNCASINAWLQHCFDEALRYAHESIAIARVINAQPQIAYRLVTLSGLYIEMDDCAQAKLAAFEALHISRTIQNREFIVGALCNLAQAELILGNINAAAPYLEEGYVLCQTPDFSQNVFIGLACMGMGYIALSRREYDHALKFLLEGLERSKVFIIKVWILSVLAGVICTKVAVSGPLRGHRGAMPYRAMADVQRAVKLWGAVEALLEKMGTALAPIYRRWRDAWVAEARSHIAPTTFDEAWAEGRELSLDEAVALAVLN